MANFLCAKRWNPYLAGVLAGLLAVVSVFVSTKVLSKAKYLGTSTTFVRATGLAERALWKEHVEENEYFKATKVKADWQMLLVAGIFLGALLSSLLGWSYRSELVPPVWRERFGYRPLLRAVMAFLGGAAALFGVRLAGGCPSGHGLSGIMQLSVSGLIAMVCFMAGGIVTARILYKGGK